MPGAAQLVGTAIAGRAALCAAPCSTSACWRLCSEGCAAPMSASGNAMGWGFRSGARRNATALAIRGATDEATPCSPRSTRSDVHFARSISSAAWPAHGCRLGRAPSPRRSARLLSAAETAAAKGTIRRRGGVSADRYPIRRSNQRAEVARARSDLSKVRVRAWPRGSPSPCATMMPLNRPPYQKNSNTWAILLVPSMRPLTPLSPSQPGPPRLGFGLLDTRTRWPNNAAHLPRHFVGPPSPRRSRIVKQRL